jgi:hypothetical protein
MGRCSTSRYWIEHRLAESTIPEPNSGCLIWLGTTVSGYAVIGRRQMYLTRILMNTPSDKLALHKCDVRSCVNVNHLYNGNHSANLSDAWERTRCR